MIYLSLFLGFLKVGCFAFGGAYGAIPLIRDVVLSYGWLTDEELTYMIAVSESTPGPIMVNLATYVGSSQGGFPGAALATFAVVLPSFLVILAITAIVRNLTKNTWVQAAMRGLKPCVTGIVLATGVFMICKNSILAGDVRLHIREWVLTGVLGVLMFGSRIFGKKKLSPICLILLAAGLGIVVYGI